MPYGLHAGKAFDVIPTGYLRWVASEVCHRQKHVLAVHAVNALVKRGAAPGTCAVAEPATHRCDRAAVVLLAAADSRKAA